jgi:hypothetical protein
MHSRPLPPPPRRTEEVLLVAAAADERDASAYAAYTYISAADFAVLFSFWTKDEKACANMEVHCL